MQNAERRTKNQASLEFFFLLRPWRSWRLGVQLILMSSDNGRIELAILKPDALPAQVHKVATDVVQGGYAGVVVSPIYVSRVATTLFARPLASTVTTSTAYR